MPAPAIDAREIPVEWIAREYRKMHGIGCSVDGQGQEDEEEMQHAVEENWWSVWSSFSTQFQQLSFTASLHGLSAETADCTVQPMALGCDGLLLALAAIFAVLVALKACVLIFQR